MNDGAKWTMIANSVVWISSSIAILGTVYITKDSNCLWAFLIPAFFGGFSYTRKDI